MFGEFTREQQLTILGVILLILTGLGVTAYRRLAPMEAPPMLIAEASRPGEIAADQKLLVHVVGGVKQEGVYSLKFGDRVIDAVNLAGGVSALADLSAINLAEKVKDGQKIIIPVKSVVVDRGLGDLEIGGLGTNSRKVNINTAGAAELAKVKGIGSKTAQKVVDYRKANGPFTKLEDLVKVKTIGKGKFEKMKELISI